MITAQSLQEPVYLERPLFSHLRETSLIERIVSATINTQDLPHFRYSASHNVRYFESVFFGAWDLILSALAFRISISLHFPTLRSDYMRGSGQPMIGGGDRIQFSVFEISYGLSIVKLSRLIARMSVIRKEV